MNTEDRLKLIEKVEALLRQAESTDFDDEAKAFTAKAQELMTRYSLSDAELMTAGAVEQDKIVTRQIEVNGTGTIGRNKADFLYAIANVYGVKVVRGYDRNRTTQQKRDRYNGFREKEDGSWNTKGGLPPIIIPFDKPSKNYSFPYLTGWSKDVEATVSMYGSLLVQMKYEMARSGGPEAWENRQTWEGHFIEGYANTVTRRLREVYKSTTDEVVNDVKAKGGDLLPVLVSRKKQVEEEYEAIWKGQLSRGRSRYSTSGTSGFGSGRDAGGRASLGNASLGGRKALGA